jgi:hypothetical protein
VIEDVGVDHGRADVLVAEQGLDRADVGAALEQVGGEAVAQGVGGDPFVDAGGEGGAAEGALDVGFVEMVPAYEAGTGVAGRLRCGEDPLPFPVPAGVGVFARDRVGQLDAGQAGSAVGVVGRADSPEMSADLPLESVREERRSIAVAPALADEDLAAPGIEVLDA